MKQLIRFAVSLVLVSGGAIASELPTDLTDSLQPEQFAGAPVIGKFRNTYYYVASERDFSSYEINTAIRDLQGNVIEQTSKQYKKALDIEGSGKLRNDKVVNYHGRVDGDVRYKVVSEPWGRGVGTCALSPFHTIAVDPETIPLGSVVQIDETKGMLLPDGSHHNGLWKAEDIGNAIKKDRIDLFIGLKKYEGTLSRAGIDNLEALTVRLVQKPSGHSCKDEQP